MLLKYNVTCYKQKANISLVTRPLICYKFDFCFQILRKDKNGIKANLQESQLQLFSNKNDSPTASKIFAIQFIFTNHLKHKALTKTIYRKPSLREKCHAVPRQLCAQQLEEHSSWFNCFLRILGFLDLFGKLFSEVDFLMISVARSI